MHMVKGRLVFCNVRQLAELICVGAGDAMKKCCRCAARADDKRALYFASDRDIMQFRCNDSDTIMILQWIDGTKSALMRVARQVISAG